MNMKQAGEINFKTIMSYLLSSDGNENNYWERRNDLF